MTTALLDPLTVTHPGPPHALAHSSMPTVPAAGGPGPFSFTNAGRRPAVHSQAGGGSSSSAASG